MFNIHERWRTFLGGALRIFAAHAAAFMTFYKKGEAMNGWGIPYADLIITAVWMAYGFNGDKMPDVYLRVGEKFEMESAMESAERMTAGIRRKYRTSGFNIIYSGRTPPTKKMLQQLRRHYDGRVFICAAGEWKKVASRSRTDRPYVFIASSDVKKSLADIFGLWAVIRKTSPVLASFEGEVLCEVIDLCRARFHGEASAQELDH